MVHFNKAKVAYYLRFLQLRVEKVFEKECKPPTTKLIRKETKNIFTALYLGQNLGYNFTVAVTDPVLLL